jgi:hypothetical protein
MREAFVAREVEPVDYVLALRRFPGTDLIEDRLALASYALKAGDDLLFLARSELKETLRIDPRSETAARLAPTLERKAIDALVRDGTAALETADDPATALVLARAARNAFSGTADEAVADLEARATARLAEDDLPAEARERRARAEADRLARAVRRAALWRERALALLARTGATVLDFERARRAAYEAEMEARFAANETPADATAALAEAERAAEVRRRAILGVGRRLLEAGLAERARAATAIALIRDPNDKGAIAQMFVIEGELARRATREGGR